MPTMRLSMVITSTFEYTNVGSDGPTAVEALEAEVRSNPKLWLQLLATHERATVTWRAELAKEPAR